jgi:putative restriction endonuclease
MPRVFGDIPGFPPGHEFPDRKALAAAGVHRPLQSGISGASGEGADSIVISGGYEDDEDFGDAIVYTGEGGRDPSSGRQIADQEFIRGNAALTKSCVEGLPVRVVRRSRAASAISFQSGYRYDGLYRVEHYWKERGRSGFVVCRFRLVEQASIQQSDEIKLDSGPVARVNTNVQRLARSNAVARKVKDMYEHRCQVCGITLQTRQFPYAESAHIRPLGRPHDGPDIEANLLCLCPNDHVKLDFGAIFILDDLTIVDALTDAQIGTLIEKPDHKLNREYLAYHRNLFLD